MTIKKAGKKKATKKKGKKREIEDPPIIVGGGGSEIIQIRADLMVSAMPPASGYTRFRVSGVNIRSIDVDGHVRPVNPNTNRVTFLE